MMDTATNDVTVLAGLYGTPGTDDGTTGNVARFSSPTGLVLDGNLLYVGDDGNHLIRSVDVTNGATTTVAGTGSPGYLDATGTAAQFSQTGYLLLSGTTLYVGDLTNHVIRSVDTSNWAVTTLAGVAGTAGYVDGAAASAEFNGPAGMALSGTVLYVCDHYTHRIRTVDTSALTVGTLAGSGVAGAADGFGTAAQFYNPWLMQIVGSTMYVSDRTNHAIRAIDLGTDEVTTFTGQLGTPGAVNGDYFDSLFNAPAGLAVFGTLMWVVEHENHDVRMIQLPPPPPPAPPPPPPVAAGGSQCPTDRSYCKACNCNRLSITDKIIQKASWSQVKR